MFEIGSSGRYITGWWTTSTLILAHQGLRAGPLVHQSRSITIQITRVTGVAEPPDRAAVLLFGTVAAVLSGKRFKIISCSLPPICSFAWVFHSGLFMFCIQNAYYAVRRQGGHLGDCYYYCYYCKFLNMFMVMTEDREWYFISIS